MRIPTITDPRGTDFPQAGLLKQAPWMQTLERRAIDAFVWLGVAMTDACINYQTILAPTRGEHLAFGDTGVVIYSNAVCGARSNFEGGPSALSAGIAERIPHDGFHPDAQRQATVRIRVDWTPGTLNEWGALGGVIGRLPVAHRIGHADVLASQQAYAVTNEVDVVALSAPQLSLYELRRIAELSDGRRFARPMLAVTSPQVKPDADRMGYTDRIEAAGGQVLSGMCFYQSYARRDRGSQRLEAAGDQQREARQHLRRLRVRADARVDGAVH